MRAAVGRNHLRDFARDKIRRGASCMFLNGAPGLLNKLRGGVARVRSATASLKLVQMSAG